MNEDAARIAVARRYVGVGRPESALAELAKLPDPDLEDPELWFLRAAALNDLERYGDAIDAAREGLARSPQSVGLLAALSQAELGCGNLAAAETAILSALDLWPDNPWLLTRYASVVAHAGQLDKAERLVAEAARLSPDDPTVIHTRSVIAYLRGEDAAAEAESRRLLADDPESVPAHLMLGTTAAQAGRFAQADRHLSTAAGIGPTDDIASLAREARVARHPLLLPIRAIDRFGVAPVWIGGVAVILGLRALGYPLASAVAGLAWFTFCVYTWVAPPLVRRWAARRAP